MNIKNNLIYVFIIFWTCFGFSSTEDIIFSLDQDTIEVAPGRVENIYITALVPKNFHAYSDKIKINKIFPENFILGQIKIKNEKEFYDKFSKKNRMAFTESGQITVQLETPIDINETVKQINFDFYYQICSEKVCFLPRMQTIYLNVAVNKKPVIQITTEPTKEKDLTLIEQLESAFKENIFYAFLISFLAGILTSFTPCIFPMIPITLSILGHNAEKNTRSENIIRSLLYVLGIALTYSILGVLAALTGSLFGNALSNRYVLIFMFLLFFLLALGMWGFIEIQAPAFIRNKFGLGKKQSFAGIFLMGLISGIVASPCVGPVLVSILSYVSLTKNAVLGFWLLFTYAVGLGLIFILIGAFSNLIRLLPKSGAWMNRIKFILGLLMILTGLYYLKLAFPMVTFSPTEQSISKTQLNWQPYSEDKLIKAQAQQQPVLIDFRADWCAACHELEEKTFSQAGFKILTKDFMLLKVDATEDTPEVQVILKKYNVKGLPTVLFVNRNGLVLDHLTFTQFLDWTDLKPKVIEASQN